MIIGGPLEPAPGEVMIIGIALLVIGFLLLFSGMLKFGVYIDY